MPCHIRLAQFEGPLELLLSLIEERKLDVTRVSLGAVADQYLEHLSSDRESISLENLASFLVIAARLILIKSKMLLPVLEFTDEEEAAMEDLEIRLIEYKRFREISEEISVLLSTPFRSFSREKFLGAPEVFAPPKGVNAESLLRHFESVLGEIPEPEQIVEETIEEVMSLEERIASLQSSLLSRAECSFRELASVAENRMEVIVSFLAVLELVKQRFVSVRQQEIFDDIHITTIKTERISVF